MYTLLHSIEKSKIRYIRHLYRRVIVFHHSTPLSQLRLDIRHGYYRATKNERKRVSM